jgi:CubicO group peptidase (beta-lactamase class C family)
VFRTLPAAVALLLAAAPAVAQEKAPKTGRRPAAKSAPERVETLLEPLRERHGLPALGAAFVHRGELLAIGVTGVRKHGAKTKVTIDDKWHIGSCTKSMTATLVARMVERGELSWKTTLAEAFPDLKKRMDPAYRDVTLELLLTNRSGAPHTLDAGGLWARLWARRGTAVEQRRQLLEGVVTQAPAYEPGEKTLYSNAGFAIAGHIAETQAGKPWEDLLRAEVFEPLGMQSAGYGVTWSRKRVEQPWGHTPGKQGPVPVRPGPLADNPPSIGPGGTVHCSLSDWAKYIGVHARTKAAEPALLKTATLTKLHTPPDGSDYAFGWVVAKRSWAGGSALWHNGTNTSWYALVWMAPKRDFAVLAISNMGGPAAAEACDQAIGALLEHVGPKLKKRIEEDG